jgi:hypothetical protein
MGHSALKRKVLFSGEPCRAAHIGFAPLLRLRPLAKWNKKDIHCATP